MDGLSGGQKPTVHLCAQFWGLGIKSGFMNFESAILERLIKYEDINPDVLYFSIFDHESSAPSINIRRINVPWQVVFRYATGSRYKPIAFARSIINIMLGIVKKFCNCNSFIKGSKDDIYVFFENVIPTIKLQGKIIAVIHDIIPLKEGIISDVSSVDKNSRRKCFQDTMDILNKADRIITVSEFSRQDIAETFKIDPNRIDVIYNGIDTDKFSRECDREMLRKKYNLPEKYVLYFGACVKRKNVEELVRAYALVPEALRREYKLVITNPNGSVKSCVNDNGLSEDVCYIYDIPEKDKLGIYQMASVSAWLSVYEGFGIPIVEAMAAGVPVVCSNVTSHPEVAGDAAIMVDPHDTRGIAAAIERVLTDESLRQELIAKGYENIKRFSWDESAKRLYDIIINL